MGEIKDIVDLITKLVDSVKDRKFSAELRDIQKLISQLQNEHLQIQEARLKVLGENAELKLKNVDLEKKLFEANQKLVQKQSQENLFVEYRGALFKRKPEGGYHRAVYCPMCKSPAGGLEQSIPYSCSCGWLATFAPYELSTIMKDLPK